MLTSDMKNEIEDLLKNYKFAEAFRLARTNVMTDKYSQDVILEILRVRNNVALLYDDIDSIREDAENGNPYMQLAYGRLHELLMHEPDSIEIYSQSCVSAHEAGIADARAYLAIAYRDGDFGGVDLDKYHSELDFARLEGSRKAEQLILRDLISGYNDTKADPKTSHSRISNIIANSGERVEPVYYDLLADAEYKLGNKEEAIKLYEKAFREGYMPSLFFWAYYSCCGSEGEIADVSKFEEMMNLGRDILCSDSFLTYPMLLDEETFNSCSDGDKANLQKALEADLTLADLMGDPLAAYYLGLYYEDGMFGFERNQQKARKWYERGVLLRSEECTGAILRMDDFEEDLFDMHDDDDDVDPKIIDLYVRGLLD